MNNTKNRVAIKDVKVTKTFNGQDIYDVATSPTRNVSPWIKSIQSVGDFGAIEISYTDDKSDDHQKVVLVPDQIGQAFAKCVEMGFTHCSGYPLEDIDDADACTADLVLQMAVFGEIVWG